MNQIKQAIIDRTTARVDSYAGRIVPLDDFR